MTHVDAPFPPKREKRKERRRNRKPLPLWAETLVLLVIALGLAIVLKQFFVQAFYIPSGSMEPGLLVKDRILVEKWSYWDSSPKRGDIIVFSDPAKWLQGEDAQSSTNAVTSTLGAVGLYPLGGHLVKRVIGIAGDHVDCDPGVDGGQVRVNGFPLPETAYLPKGVVTCTSQSRWASFHEIVPPGDLWVMGDNRDNSADSRAHMDDADGPFVPVKDVVGKVFAVVWPLGHMQTIGRPSFFDKVPAPAVTAPAPTS